VDGASLRKEGVGRLDYALQAPTIERLRGEASALKPTAHRIQTELYELYTDGQDFRSPVRFGIADRGDELFRLHQSSELRDLANALADTPMEPTKAGYLYYDVGDRIGIHTDLPACELVLLAALDDGAPPLVVHPELRTRTPEELVDLALRTEGAPPGGISVPLHPSGLCGLFGGGLPHQTRPVEPGGEAVVITLCFAGLPK
jgi:hypothetical protein